MEAKIVGINLQKGRAVALISTGEYILLELFTDELELHDEISGNFEAYPLGGEIIRNVTSGESMDVLIQDYCSKDLAINYLRG